MSEDRAGAPDPFAFLDAARSEEVVPAPATGLPGVIGGRRRRRRRRQQPGLRNDPSRQRVGGFVHRDVYRQARRAMEDLEDELKEELGTGGEKPQFGQLVEMLLVQWLEDVGRPVE